MPGQEDFITGPLSVAPMASSEAENVSHGMPGNGTGVVDTPLKANLGQVESRGCAASLEGWLNSARGS